MFEEKQILSRGDFKCFCQLKDQFTLIKIYNEL